jgi:hypothetical protein
MADSLSEWRAKAAERDAARDVRPVERGFTPQQNEELNSWALQHRDQEFEHRIKPEIDGVIEATAEVFDELRAKIRELELQLSELRGELKGMRGESACRGHRHTSECMAPRCTVDRHAKLSMP